MLRRRREVPTIEEPFDLGGTRGRRSLPRLAIGARRAARRRRCGACVGVVPAFQVREVAVDHRRQITHARPFSASLHKERDRTAVSVSRTLCKNPRLATNEDTEAVGHRALGGIPDESGGGGGHLGSGTTMRSWVTLKQAVMAGVMALGIALAWPLGATVSAQTAGLDTADATGSGTTFTNITIHAQSGTSGQNPSGSVDYIAFGDFHISGPVTCLSVTGRDMGGGTEGSPTVAVLNDVESTSSSFPGQVVTTVLIDSGGGTRDVLGSQGTGRALTDCSLPVPNLIEDALTNGRAVVFDAPPLPTSKDQCKDGGWRNFPKFKNQGDCVSFVETGK